MIDKDRNENRRVFSSLVTFNCTFISHMKVSVLLCVCVCVCGSVEGVSGSDIKSDCEGECLTLCVLVSPLHVCVCLDDDRAACCGREVCDI